MHISYASLAIMTSSSVGMTATLILLFGVEINASLPWIVELSASSISTPNASLINSQTALLVLGSFSPIPADHIIKSAPPSLT